MAPRPGPPCRPVPPATKMGALFMVARLKELALQWAASFALRHRRVKGVQRDRYHAVEADEISHLVHATLAECGHTHSIKRFRQRATRAQCMGNVIPEILSGAEVGGF